jgi:hypothetical protein
MYVQCARVALSFTLSIAKNNIYILLRLGLQRYDGFLDLSTLIQRIIFLLSFLSKVNYSIPWSLYEFYGGYK